MDFHDFLMFLGKSGKFEIHPPKLCASLGPNVSGVLRRISATSKELADLEALPPASFAPMVVRSRGSTSKCPLVFVGFNFSVVFLGDSWRCRVAQLMQI